MSGHTPSEPVAWQWRSFFNGRWGAWIELEQPIESFKTRNALMFAEGIYEARPLFHIDPAANEAKIEALTAALREIVDPISAIRERLKPGEVINDFMANKIADDSEYLRNIARAALTSAGEK